MPKRWASGREGLGASEARRWPAGVSHTSAHTGPSVDSRGAGPRSPLPCPILGVPASSPTGGTTGPCTRVCFQAPTVTIEGFLRALSLAVDKQFEEKKQLSSCV